MDRHRTGYIKGDVIKLAAVTAGNVSYTLTKHFRSCM